MFLQSEITNQLIHRAKITVPPSCSYWFLSFVIMYITVSELILQKIFLDSLSYLRMSERMYYLKENLQNA